MGKVFLLEKKDFNTNSQTEVNYLLKIPLNENEAKELLIIQNEISKEISEPISLLTKNGLIQESIYQPKGLIYCISRNDNGKCVGYGYGYIEPENENIFRLDTIGVHSDYRRKGIGLGIKIALIKKAFENAEINQVKSITQPDNNITIKINEKLGFKTID